MTPDDVAAIRAEMAFAPEDGIHPERVCALCDALEAAWAERDEWKREWHGMDEAETEACVRAERAEARAYESEADAVCLALALARVRAVCDEMESFCCDTSPDWAADIRAAIEGDDQ